MMPEDPVSHENVERRRAMRLLLFYGLFSGIGLAMAAWLGFAWFVLSQALPRIIFAVPPLYVRAVRFLYGSEFANAEKMTKSGRWITSPSYARSALVFTLLTLIAFWKANIPLIPLFLSVIAR